MKGFISQIRASMDDQQISIADLSDRSGVSVAYIYRVLDGKQTPSMKIADQIAAALGLVITTAPAR